MHEKQFTRIARSVALSQGLPKSEVSKIEVSRVQASRSTVTFYGKDFTLEIMRKLTSLYPTKEVYFDF